HHESESSGDGEATARFHQCPVHIHLQSYCALMQEAARACPAVCPVSGPRRTHARVRRRREPDAKRFNATLMTRNWSGAVRLPKRSAGLASCCSSPLAFRISAATAIHGDGRLDLNNALPHDSVTSRAGLVEENVNCKRSDVNSRQLTAVVAHLQRVFLVWLG